MIPPTPQAPAPSAPLSESAQGAPSALLDAPDFEQFDRLLDLLRERDDEAPQWEFLEGALAALVCSRQAVPASDYAPLLLGVERDDPEAFGSANDTALFWQLWERRWAEVASALAAEVQSLEDEACYHPEVLDMRGALAALPAGEQDQVLQNAGAAGDENAQDQLEDGPPESLPSFAQVWALGFMFVVENWGEHWEAPRDKELAQWLDQALSVLVDLTEDDRGTPVNNLYDETGPPSVSQARTDAYAQAIWAVYDLHQLWHSLGPKTVPQRASDTPGRNDPCSCGSGKKYKKCCGA